MKHYKNINNDVFAINDDGTQDHLLTDEWVLVSDEELILLRTAPPPPIPTVVTMRQARLALLGASLLPTVNAAIEAMTGSAGEAARIEWEYAATVDRASPLVAGLTAALSLTTDQLDTLFLTASGL